MHLIDYDRVLGNKYALQMLQFYVTLRNYNKLSISSLNPLAACYK